MMAADPLWFPIPLFLWQAFWCSSYHELNDRLASHVGAQYPGYFVIVSQLVHLGICADFFYYYFKALKSGGPMMLPVSSKVEV